MYYMLQCDFNHIFSENGFVLLDSKKFNFYEL